VGKHTLVFNGEIYNYVEQRKQLQEQRSIGICHRIR
jgi:asparagine synthetase B (glutamine-hydrolysing)